MKKGKKVEGRKNSFGVKSGGGEVRDDERTSQGSRMAQGARRLWGQRAGVGKEEKKMGTKIRER